MKLLLSALVAAAMVLPVVGFTPVASAHTSITVPIAGSGGSGSGTTGKHKCKHKGHHKGHKHKHHKKAAA